MARPANHKIRQTIIESAYALFYKNGYRGVSMEQVAAASGIKKANLFHYYSTKEKLALAVLDGAILCLKKRIAQQFVPGPNDPVKTIKNIFSEISKRMKNADCCGGCFIGNIAQELCDHNPAIRKKVADYLRFWENELEQFLLRAVQQKKLSKKLPTQMAAESIVCLIEGSMMLSKAYKQTKIFDQASRFIVGYLDNYKTGGD